MRELVVGLDQPVTLRGVGIKRESLDELATRSLGYQPVLLNPRPIRSAPTSRRSSNSPGERRRSRMPNLRFALQVLAGRYGAACAIND